MQRKALGALKAHTYMLYLQFKHQPSIKLSPKLCRWYKSVRPQKAWDITQAVIKLPLLGQKLVFIWTISYGTA